MSSYIGWDIGGAHLKLAQLGADGTLITALQKPCPMWHGIDTFSSVASQVLQNIDATAVHGITMTGEMADCFATRAEGVACILESLQTLLAKPFQVYLLGRGLCDVQTSLRSVSLVGAANWHATAQCAAVLAPEGVLMDIGSTTTDIVPFSGGQVLAVGGNDGERLASDELIYTGIVRTPVMAVVDEIKMGHRRMPVVAEQFATMADVYRLTGELPEYIDQYPVCDGGSKTVSGSTRRLARMFGYDGDDETFWCEVAALIAGKQKQTIMQACRRIYQRCGFDKDIPIIGAGAGRFLIKQIALNGGWRYRCFSELLGMHEQAIDYASAISIAQLLYQQHKQ